MKEGQVLQKLNIIFYGPVGKKNSTRIGGGEAGNKKTIAILESFGFNVIIVAKPYPLEVKFIKGILFPLQIAGAYIKFVAQLIKTTSPKTFHLSGFYNHLIYFEYFFIATCRLFKIRSVYEIRAGGAIEGYKERSGAYRFFFRATLKKADSILCQGMEYVGFVDAITPNKALYYPNYILDVNYKPYSANNRDAQSVLQLVYFGRIVPAKNIEFILDICKGLKAKGIAFYMELIGGSNGDDAYIKSLEELMNEHNITENIKMTGAVKPDKLFSILEHKHFFIFPTVEKREGHSNSLTEAMSYGVVPVASNVGFNKTVINDDSLIIEKFVPEEYINRIAAIWLDGKWHETSIKVHKRVGDFFTEGSVKSTLLTAHLQPAK